MELNDPNSFLRLTGLAYFKPDAGTYSGIDLAFANIKMVKLPTNPKTITATLNKRGNTVLAKRDTHMVEPVFEITVDQWATPTMPLQLMGDRIADLTQGSATGSTFTFTAKAGCAYQIGKYNLTIQHVKVSTTEAVAGVDYFIDDPNITQVVIPSTSQNGVIHIPVTPGSVITDGATVVVTYDVPALTRKQYTAFSKLNQSGTLTVYLEDTSGADARMIWSCKVQLSAKSVGDYQPDKFTEAVLEASCFGFPALSLKG